MMKEKWNYIIYLIWFSYLTLSAIIMFGHGFMLSRKTLSDISACKLHSMFDCEGKLQQKDNTCNLNDKIQHILSNIKSPLICGVDKKRVVFIIVDALRYDFTTYYSNIDNPLPYQNKLPFIQELLERSPNQSRLFRFIADPPTTTLQRVKALITGSLPTFVDASANFAAMELKEDNVIDQVVRFGGKTVLLGDDTWARLLPGRWMRSHALYSFHTWDLDTVDNEVDSRIYGELEKNDWNLLVAHYLGVDHAGHRYGPNHPEMKRKLNELNMRLHRIVDNLPHDSILYVVGDHGMTDSGDHGGDSMIERTAAFFAYSKNGFGEFEYDHGREVQQTDFAPTLSAALGRPPPAPSLGSLVLSALPKMTTQQTVLHLTNNLKQVVNYLLRYREVSQQLPNEKLVQFVNETRKLLEKAQDVKSVKELLPYATAVRSLLDNMRSVCRGAWIDFDSLAMLRALLLFLLVIFFNWLITEGIPVEQIPSIFASSFVTFGVSTIAICICVCSLGYFFEIIENLEHAIILSTGLLSGLITCVLVIMNWENITQRWYESKGELSERIARVALVTSAIVLVSNSYVIEEGAGLSFLFMTVTLLVAWKVKTLRSLILWVCIGLIMVASRSYRACREEQGECWTAGGGVTTGSSSGQATRGALILSLTSIGGIVAAARRYAGWRGHGIVAAAALAGVHWAVGWGALGSIRKSRLLARASWLVVATMFALLLRRERRGATIPLTAFVLLLYVINTLVLGAAMAPAASLALLSAWFTITLIANIKNNGTSKFSLGQRCNSSVTCTWALLAAYQFYGTGHHATLGHIRWAPAFHAGDPTRLFMGKYISAALVSLELFGMPLLFGAAVPLLVLWGPSGASNVGPRTQLSAVFVTCLKFCLCFAIRAFSCALASTVHCRHLMVWGVFAPKLLFESGMCAAALFGTILGAIVTTWHITGTKCNS